MIWSGIVVDLEDRQRLGGLLGQHHRQAAGAVESAWGEVGQGVWVVITLRCDCPRCFELLGAGLAAVLSL